MLDIATIALAIHLSAPNLNMKSVKHYAKVMHQQEVKRGLDSLMIVAIARHESHWNQNIISNDYEDWGLLQIRARFVDLPSKYLLDGGTNIRVGSAFIVSAQEFCEKQLERKPTNQEWLSTYQGSKSICKSTNLSFKVESYRQCIYDSLLNQTTYKCDEIYKNYKYNGIYPIKN